MTQRAKRLLTLIVAASAITSAFWFFRADSQPLRIDLAGYTNHFRGLGREAVLALTNQSDAPFVVTFLPERRNPEWPIHSRMVLNGNVNPHLILPSHSATNFEVRLQPNDGVWRVRVLYRNPTITKWQGIRNRWTVQLLARKQNRLAAFVQPKLAETILTPEMKL
jgi:hypothetical protein